jgi:hypothetical protein
MRDPRDGESLRQPVAVAAVIVKLRLSPLAPTVTDTGSPGEAVTESPAGAFNVKM